MRNLLIVACGALLAGCGLFGKDSELKPLEPNPLPDIASQVSVERHWQYRIGGDQSGLRPALAAGRVFIANPDGQVVALNVQDGNRQWRTRLDIRISGGVGVGEGLVMLGGLDGTVVALDSRDGSEVWRTRVDSEVLAAPGASAGIAVVRTIDGGVTGLSTASGERRWNMQRDEPSLTLRGDSPPLLDQGVAVLGFSDGKLAAVNVTTGATLWELPVARPSGTNEVERMIDVDASPLLVGNMLYAAAFQGNITAFELGANQVRWRQDVSTYADFAVDQEQVYIADSLGRVHALDRMTGERNWVQEKLLRRRLSGPAAVGERLVVGDYQGYLHVMDSASGELIGRRDFGDRIATQPLVRGQRLLVMTEDGSLNAVTIQRREP